MTASRAVSHYPPGDTAKVFRPGDIVLFRDRGQDWLTNLIQAGERARYGNTDWARWDHSALIVTDTGGTIEAEAQGIIRRTLASHVAEDYFIVNTGASKEQRQLAVAFTTEMLGKKYGILTFVGLAIQALTGWNLSVHMDQQFICSELVSRATEKYVPWYPRSPDSMMPADLAAYWGAQSGEPPVPLGRFARFLDALRTVSRAVFRIG